jgi:hypothetical protein
MTKVERQQLIELGILTEDCDPSVTSLKLSPQRKREAKRRQRRLKERELMAGLLLTRILDRIKRAH